MAAKLANMTTAASTLQFDEDGNLLAQVTPRKGTLANLLSVTDAGDGEVATASDMHAIVVYHKDIATQESIGLPIHKSGFDLIVNATLTPAGVPTGVTELPIASGTSVPDNYVDAANNRLITPDYVVNPKYPTTDSTLIMALSLKVFLYGLDANSVVKIYLEASTNGTTWTAVESLFKLEFTASSAGVILTTGAIDHIRNGANSTFKYYRFLIDHNSVAAPAGGEISAVIKYNYSNITDLLV